MDNKKFDSYLQDRYQKQINWYDKKSIENKKYYYIFQYGVIVLSAMLPVFIVTVGKSWFTAIVSIILAIGIASIKAFKFQENWMNYRTTCETLKKEMYFYEANTNEYLTVDNKEALFVDRVENLISRENTLWVTTHIQEEKKQ